MKNTHSVIEQTPLQKCNYDALLEELLPAIHKAATSIQGGQHTRDISTDIRLAGLRGFKDMFLRLNDRSRHGEPREILLQAISRSMLEQARLNDSSSRIQ